MRKKSKAQKENDELRKIIDNMMTLMDKLVNSFQITAEKLSTMETRLKIVEAKQDLREGNT